MALKENKWLSHDILNKMTEIMAHDILRTLTEEINCEFFSVILDETFQSSPEEHFVGFHETSTTTANTLFQLLSDVFMRFSLQLKKCRGQCCDGASNMSALKLVCERVCCNRSPEHNTCTAHLVNLVVHDVTQNIPACRSCMTLICELITLIGNSPKRFSWFQMFQGKESPSLKPLFPTRCTVRPLCNPLPQTTVR